MTQSCKGGKFARKVALPLGHQLHETGCIDTDASGPSSSETKTTLIEVCLLRAELLLDVGHHRRDPNARGGGALPVLQVLYGEGAARLGSCHQKLQGGQEKL